MLGKKRLLARLVTHGPLFSCLSKQMCDYRIHISTALYITLDLQLLLHLWA